MHYGRFVGLMGGALLAAPLLARADAPVLNAQTLGITESVLHYCAPIDPGSATRLRQKIKLLQQGANEQQLATVRNSKEYRKAYDSMVEFVGKVDAHNAKRVCSESAARSK